MALSPKGIMRVVWERSRSKPNGSTEINRIPFLSVARSLGDFWSFNSRTEKYAVSPNPDVSVIPLDLSVQKFVVIASDGLWNVMTPNDVVSFIHDYQTQDDCHQPKDVVSALIREALHRWGSKGLQADNIAILIAFLSEEDPKSCNKSGIQKSSSPLKTVAGPSSPSSSCPNDIDTRSSVDTTIPTHSPTPVVEPSPSSDADSLSLKISPPKHEINPAALVNNKPSTATTLTELEMKMKLKIKKRKHKKHRKHGLERELARYQYCAYCH